ncbi:glycerate kinase family protein [Acinetobacter indicus]|uniref:glycerate kinase family protein n=1 Tax=Acinetobacter indicus TaxID=756892 RepID=UPI0009490237|nr:glycerate kinase [Acinetobacter indicus]MCO8087767.1 glycerate kinase [Acinetobacter indicus]MCO8099765.1 glycerate kinase [Acinetobacter indicus]MCO8105305.1 glycerate kinase [Acinetobacter indicus]MCO8111005.1 glycerate kinase [Acinetobacter indicus]MDM1244649.1 glycerate kinase [Acinetobacter indicus]
MPLRFVIAPDSFKESLSAVQAAQAMQRGILRQFPDAICRLVPLADGGEGTVDALLNACAGQKVACRVRGPLPQQQVESYFALMDEGKTAVIEMAKANGIHLIPLAQRNPALTSTYGTGEMIRQALDLGVSKIVIGLGGSVTNDAGSGMAQALGVKFLDQAGLEVQPCGGNLKQICEIDLSALDARLATTEMLIASDVNNPLCGEYGASAIFGPQKGATPELVKILDQNLGYFANLVETTLGVNVQHQAGAGAAGGLGFGLLAFARAKIQSGVELLIQQTGLTEKITQADVVLTGEGKIDRQTFMGKTPFGVAQVAKSLNKPVYAFAGMIGEDIEPLLEAGFTQIIGINPPDISVEDAIRNAENNLTDSVENVMRSLKKA